MELKYPHLFSPMKIGPVTIKNRIVLPAMGVALATMNGEVSANSLAYYKARAKGGCGLINVEVAEVNWKNSRAALCPVGVYTPHLIPMLRRLSDGMHMYGAKCFLQLHHGGNQAAPFNNEGEHMISASDVANTALGGLRPRAMSTEEVKNMIQLYINSAVYAKMAHFDGVELHGGHGYLINQFLSPHTNRRTDEYGGSRENRVRFAAEIIKGIIDACGPNFAVTMRISATEYTDHGYDLEEGCELAKLLEKAGCMAFNCSFGNYESYPGTVEPMGFEEGWRVYMTEAIKRAVTVPVYAMGNIRNPEFAEKIVADGRTDFVSIGRGQLCDPEWANKARFGKDKEIRRCISCMTCLFNVLGNSHVMCACNPECGNEAEDRPIIKDGNNRKVVIVGAGPGGLEAARILATRGFNVVVMEKSNRLGGTVVLASRPVGKEKMMWFIEYLKYQMELLGVDIRLNTEATEENILAEDPYAVFIAAGGNPIIPKSIPGINNLNVMDAEEYLESDPGFTDKKVIIIGGGLVGCETATLAGHRGNDVTVVEMLSEFATGMYPDSRTELIHKLEKVNAKVITEIRVTAINNNGVEVENVTTCEKQILPADIVLRAIGKTPNNRLFLSLEGKIEHLYAVGDTIHQGNIIDATRTGHIFALELD